MGIKLGKAPVFFALVQVIFDEQLRLDEKVASVQEKFKAIGFPVYGKQQYFTATVSSGLALPNSVTAPSIQVQARHIFGTLDQSSTFVLERNSLAFNTTKYQDYDVFSDTYFAGLAAVHEALQLSYVDRIGTRYLDAVVPQAGETLDQYLVPSVLGVSHLIDKPLQHSLSETVFLAGKMRLVVRTITQDGMIGVPMELGELMPPNPAFSAITGRCSTLDTDAGVEERVVFNMDSIKSTLKVLHDEASKAFKLVVTEFALARWA